MHNKFTHQLVSFYVPLVTNAVLNDVPLCSLLALQGHEEAFFLNISNLS